MQIKDLPASTTIATTDVLPKETSGGVTQKITAQNMANSVKSLANLPNTTEMNDAIAQSTATASTTATLASGWSVANEQNIIYKSVNVASLSLWANGEKITQNAWNQIATIPSDYIPLKAVDFLGINNGNDKAVHCQITFDGRVLVYGSADAGTNLRLFVTYFCG